MNWNDYILHDLFPLWLKTVQSIWFGIFSISLIILYSFLSVHKTLSIFFPFLAAKATWWRGWLQQNVMIHTRILVRTQPVCHIFQVGRKQPTAWLLTGASCLIDFSRWIHTDASGFNIIHHDLIFTSPTQDLWYIKQMTWNYNSLEIAVCHSVFYLPQKCGVTREYAMVAWS